MRSRVASRVRDVRRSGSDRVQRLPWPGSVSTSHIGCSRGRTSARARESTWPPTGWSSSGSNDASTAAASQYGVTLSSCSGSARNRSRSSSVSFDGWPGGELTAAVLFAVSRPSAPARMVSADIAALSSVWNFWKSRSAISVARRPLQRVGADVRERVQVLGDERRVGYSASSCAMNRSSGSTIGSL